MFQNTKSGVTKCSAKLETIYNCILSMILKTETKRWHNHKGKIAVCAQIFHQTLIYASLGLAIVVIREVLKQVSISIVSSIHIVSHYGLRLPATRQSKPGAFTTQNASKPPTIWSVICPKMIPVARQILQREALSLTPHHWIHFQTCSHQSHKRPQNCKYALML